MEKQKTTSYWEQDSSFTSHQIPNQYSKKMGEEGEGGFVAMVSRGEREGAFMEVSGGPGGEQVRVGEEEVLIEEGVKGKGVGLWARKKIPEPSGCDMSQGGGILIVGRNTRGRGEISASALFRVLCGRGGEGRVSNQGGQHMHDRFGGEDRTLCWGGSDEKKGIKL